MLETVKPFYYERVPMRVMRFRIVESTSEPLHYICTDYPSFRVDKITLDKHRKMLCVFLTDEETSLSFIGFVEHDITKDSKRFKACVTLTKYVQ